MWVRMPAAAAVLLCAFFAWTATASADSPCPGDDQAPTADTVAEAAFNLACDVNAMRAHVGLQPVTWDWRLWQAAQGMAEDMAQNQYFAHTTPDGRGLVDRVEPTGYLGTTDDWLLLENLGWGSGPLSSPLATAFAWLGSEEHRFNLFDPNVRNIAIGIAAGRPTSEGEDGYFYVADFGQDLPQPLPTPTPVAHTARSTRCVRSVRATASVLHLVWHRTRRMRVRQCARIAGGSLSYERRMTTAGQVRR